MPADATDSSRWLIRQSLLKQAALPALSQPTEVGFPPSAWHFNARRRRPTRRGSMRTATVLPADATGSSWWLRGQSLLKQAALPALSQPTSVGFPPLAWHFNARRRRPTRRGSMRTATVLPADATGSSRWLRGQSLLKQAALPALSQPTSVGFPPSAWHFNARRRLSCCP